MLDVDQAISIVLSHVRPLATTRVDLNAALFRTLSEPIATDIDQPPFDRSLMDGFAVRASDTVAVPAALTVVGQVAAGQLPERRIEAGEAMQINTGAPIPDGADAVVRVERTQLCPDQREVTILESVKPGQSITRRATYKSAGEVVLPKGAVLTPANMGVAAAAGAHSVELYRQPRVAVMVTGSELVSVNDKPSGGQIRNSNQYVLESLFRSVHCDPDIVGTVPDDPAMIEAALRQAREHDLICMTGGVSMGAFDFVPQVLAEVGATVHFHKITIKPGRPVLFATLPTGSLVFALPGNPVSAFVGFHLLIVPALAGLQGRTPVPRHLRAILKGSLGAERDRQAYYPASLRIDDNGGYEAHLLSWHGSGDAMGMAGAEGLIMRPPGSPPAGDGDAVLFIPLS